MKQLYNLFALFFVAAMLWNCSDDSNFGVAAPEEAVVTKSFAQDDGSQDLSQRTTGYIAYKLLSTAGPDVGRSLADVNITDEQYAEIKEFTDKLVEGCTTDVEVHSTVFNWVSNSIDYTWSDNDPYPVFKNKKGICQGYANLLKVMLHTQGVPCVLTNGYMQVNLGHAWCYAYFDKTWYVSDPTNNRYHKAIQYKTAGSDYDPRSLSAVLFEDEYCTYTYNEGALNVQSIKEGCESVSVPFSAGGFVVSSLNPAKVHESVKELYVGANITSFGEGIVGLSIYSAVEKIIIDPENKNFESFSAAVYDKNISGNNLVLIAPGAKHLELKAIEVFDKECKLKDLPNIETMTFVPGTKRIDAWAVERCPKLHTVFMPQETVVNSSSFTGVAGSFKIIRGNFTNIPQIKY